MDRTDQGLDGPAIAVLVSSLAAFALNTYFMERLLAVRIQSRAIGTIVVSAAASFFAVSRLNAFLPIGRFYVLAGVVLVGYAVYFLVLALVGELTKRDVRRLVEAAHLPASVGNFFARFCWREDHPEDTALIPGGRIRSGPPIPGDPAERPRGPSAFVPEDPPAE
jgi:hypothetical protein